MCTPTVSTSTALSPTSSTSATSTPRPWPPALAEHGVLAGADGRPDAAAGHAPRCISRRLPQRGGRAARRPRQGRRRLAAGPASFAPRAAKSHHPPVIAPVPSPRRVLWASLVGSCLSSSAWSVLRCRSLPKRPSSTCRCSTRSACSSTATPTRPRSTRPPRTRGTRRRPPPRSQRVAVAGTSTPTRRKPMSRRSPGRARGTSSELTVRVWVIDAGPVRAGAYTEIYANVDLTIDDNLLVSQEVHITPVPSSTGLSRLLSFSVDNIGLLGELDAGQHTVSLRINSASYADGDQVAWVMDATEVDSGIDFSPATLNSNVVVSASRVAPHLHSRACPRVPPRLTPPPAARAVRGARLARAALRRRPRRRRGRVAVSHPRRGGAGAGADAGRVPRLAHREVHADFHCVTKFSVFDNDWHGVRAARGAAPRRARPAA